MASSSQSKKKKEFALTEKKAKVKSNKTSEKAQKKVIKNEDLSFNSELDSQEPKTELLKKTKERPRILTAEGWKRMQKRGLIKSHSK